MLVDATDTIRPGFKRSYVKDDAGLFPEQNEILGPGWMG
jgi:hypothetical protein